MLINDLLSPKRISHALPASSKKRLLESISALLHEDEPEIDESAVFHTLFERERLGSTGIGEGVALPHGRLKGLKRAIGAFAILESEMDYDSIDKQPVKMVFALLVPENADEEHLRILAKLAGVFSKKELREQLLHAKNDQEIYHCLIAQTHT